MQEIIQSFFRERSLVNHQIASFDDCIPTGDGRLSRMEKIVRAIRVGTDEEVDIEDGGIINLDVIDQNIVVRMKNIQLGTPIIREANGSEHESTPMECRLRKLTYISPVQVDFTIYRNGVPSPPEKSVTVGNLPIMVRSRRCNLHPNHLAGDRVLNPNVSEEDRKMAFKLWRRNGEDPLDPGGYFIINGTEDRKSTRLNSSHVVTSYAAFCWKKKNPPPPLHSLQSSHSPSRLYPFLFFSP